MNSSTLKIAAALCLGVTASGVQAEAIRIPVNSWTGQNTSAHIAGQLLEKLDYEVEYVTAGAVPQLAAMAQGTLHFQPEFWDNNVGDIYPKALAEGDIVLIGPQGLESREGWIYPP
jgi:glycine betaine/proline transport system substrate-binding protein